MIFRLILITLILGTVIVFLIGGKPEFSPFPIYGLLVLVYVITLFYWLALRWEINPALLIYVQLSIDVLLVSGILYYSGGAESILTLLYLLVIISSSMFLRLGGILYVCTLSALAYGFISWLQYRGIVETVSFFELNRLSRVPEPSYLNVILNICFFYLVAFLSGFLAEQLRRKGEELESTSLRLRKVQLDTDDILENIPSGLITLDGEGTIQHFNGAAETILGLLDSEVQGRAYDQVFGEENQEFRAVLKSALEEAIVYERKELTATSNQGQQIPLGISTTHLGMDEGERSGVIAVFQDLTEAKELEERARQSDRLRVLGQLSAAIAHEIRNPLATISGSSEVLRESVILDGEEKKLMELITRESDRLNRIITDFLLYARVKPAERVTIELGKIIDETLVLLRNHDDYNEQIKIENQLRGQEVHALADGDQIRQIFLNIGINALQAMSGGGRLTVGLDTSPNRSRIVGKQEMLRIFFQDTGNGILTGDLSNIFEPFYSSKKGGTGLGLSIAQRIVENNGGQLEVKSQQGEGATFIISLVAGRYSEEGNHESQKK
jgi:two-component system sensor histidine kinase PilS (NtrC family)